MSIFRLLIILKTPVFKGLTEVTNRKPDRLEYNGSVSFLEIQPPIAKKLSNQILSQFWCRFPVINVAFGN
jgi:hypothetical protein